MFGWLKRDPRKQLQQRYEAKMRSAKEAEKHADRALQAELYSQAQAIYEEIEALEAQE